MKDSDNMKIRHYAKYKLKGVFSNILNQNFVTSQTNENLVLDITYIHTKQHEWSYLNFIIDLIPYL